MTQHAASVDVAATRPRRRADAWTALLAAGRRKVGEGDLGPLAVVVGLAVIWTLFQALNGHFLTPRNLSNLILQIGVLGTLSVGLVLVLILGEIDLSIGAIAGVCASTLAILLTDHHWPTWAALLAAIALGALIGLAHGTVIVGVAIPSFIVTLAGLMVWQGIQLAIVGDAGEIRIRDPFIRGIASTYLTGASGWAAAAALVLSYATLQVAGRRSRLARGLDAPSTLAVGARIVAVGASAGVVVAVMNSYFGVPWVLVILVALVMGVGATLGHTSFGRHIYAIGGNREAARRAGIRVRRVTILVFVLISALAALAGIIEASRQFSVSNALGGGTLQLNAIAAVVIGGTSLFGGRGKAHHALLGALVIGSVQNGLDLLGQASSVKNVATGLILVLAVAIDAISRRRRVAAGA